MSPFLLLLFVVSIGCDVAGQIFFKVGATSLPVKRNLPNTAAGWRDDVAKVLANRWLLAGIGTYVIEAIVWFRILAEVPISVAFPIASLNFLGVALASRWFLGETMTSRQWVGAGLVTMGVALVARVT